MEVTCTDDEEIEGEGGLAVEGSRIHSRHARRNEGHSRGKGGENLKYRDAWYK